LAVTIRIPAAWREATDHTERIELPAGDLAVALAALVERFPALRSQVYGADGQVRSALNIFVNREHVRYRGGLSAALHDGDELYIIPMVTGGAT